MKFKRINEDEPYEDGDNFDAHVGKFKLITNPYELLEKQETAAEDSDYMSSSSSESEKEEPKAKTALGLTLSGNKR